LLGASEQLHEPEMVFFGRKGGRSLRGKKRRGTGIKRKMQVF
jgi:hypothetical protein